MIKTLCKSELAILNVELVVLTVQTSQILKLVSSGQTHRKSGFAAHVPKMGVIASLHITKCGVTSLIQDDIIINYIV